MSSSVIFFIIRLSLTHCVNSDSQIAVYDERSLVIKLNLEVKENDQSASIWGPKISENIGYYLKDCI